MLPCGMRAVKTDWEKISSRKFARRLSGLLKLHSSIPASAQTQMFEGFSPEGSNTVSFTSFDPTPSLSLQFSMLPGMTGDGSEELKEPRTLGVGGVW